MNVDRVLEAAKIVIEKYNDGSPIPEEGSKDYPLFEAMVELEVAFYEEI